MLSDLVKTFLSLQEKFHKFTVFARKETCSDERLSCEIKILGKTFMFRRCENPLLQWGFALIRTKSFCCYHLDFLFEMHRFRLDIWKNFCTGEGVAGTQRGCRTCSLVKTQLRKTMVTWSGIGGSCIWRGSHTLWPPVVPSSQHVNSSVKCKSKQNTPAYLKLSMLPSLLHSYSVKETVLSKGKLGQCFSRSYKFALEFNPWAFLSMGKAHVALFAFASLPSCARDGWAGSSPTLSM